MQESNNTSQALRAPEELGCCYEFLVHILLIEGGTLVRHYSRSFLPGERYNALSFFWGHSSDETEPARSIRFPLEPLPLVCRKRFCDECKYEPSSTEICTHDHCYDCPSALPPLTPEPTHQDQHRHDRSMKLQISSSSPDKSFYLPRLPRTDYGRHYSRDKIVNQLLNNATPRILDILEKEIEHLGAAQGPGQGEEVRSASVDTRTLDNTLRKLNFDDSSR
ncbi:hypothetical protein F5Y19DRAFT_377374 [Xylariaceae sp. FL1651]|nr:hypothetical protein F5Y19DRAFT_377374 [Xylariaceae sp. FL1651]